MSRRSVALLIETSNAYARGLVEGVISFVREHDTWSIHLHEQDRGAEPPTWLARWKGDGILARVETVEIARMVKRTGLPVVDVSAARLLADVPWVETDDEAIARLAARHLLDRGFRNFGFCGDPGFNWSQWRCEHFVRAVREAGCDVHMHQSMPQSDARYSWNREKGRLAKWVEQVPRPVGVLCCYDLKAQQLLSVCRELEVHVPEEIAVIGVDNDRLVCELCTPPLTSVIPDAPRTGYEAAMLLDQLMSGETVSGQARLIRPIGIETRQSTDVLAIDDPDIAAALHFIRAHAYDGITVDEVLRQVPLSRRMLESRFQKILGRSPYQEIMRLRIERIQRLLLETDLSLQEIALRTGFQHVEYLSVAFKRETGQTPREFRRWTPDS